MLILIFQNSAISALKAEAQKADKPEKATKTFSGIAAASKAAAKLSKTGRVPKSCRASAMDQAKALGILGFTSTRWLDMSSGLTPKQELDKAHFAKMMEIMKKKKKNVRNIGILGTF